DGEARRSIRQLTFLRGCRIAISPDGRWLAVTDGTRDSLRDTRDWEERRSVAREQEDLTGPIAFTPDGKLLAAPSVNGIIRLVEVATGREVATLEPPNPTLMQWISFTAGARHLLASTGEDTVQSWGLAAIRDKVRGVGV